VQSWKFVWSKVGADQPLVIDRLWGGNSAYPVTGRPHLVVATDAKLRECLDTDAYAWLRRAALVLVDEAHVAISPLYTSLLEQLGLTSRETRCHLVGLTATPFRSNDDLTRRLAQRFGNRRLDEGIFAKAPVLELQELGVLARVEHRELRGSDVRLNADELAEVKKFTAGRDDSRSVGAAFLPRGAEQRLAEDQERNRVLLDEIAAMDEDWSILVFATSVAHAKLLAAKLGDRGISAAAIDAATPTAERRKRIEAFRARTIRVITNYGVLSQGFDAPATRAVVIARPVYSVNSYQQMIGRGLRGPKNGGKDVCLILNVRDNISNHQQLNERLAFDSFEHLWQQGSMQ
jgi:superfamily II DNA or RNA helicase